MVTGENQYILRIMGVDKIDVLRDRICRTTVDIKCRRLPKAFLPGILFPVHIFVLHTFMLYELLIDHRIGTLNIRKCLFNMHNKCIGTDWLSHGKCHNLVIHTEKPSF